MESHLYCGYKNADYHPACLTLAPDTVIMENATAPIMETYRSGHNGAHSKCVCPPGHEGSNPSVSAEKARVAALAFFYLDCIK